MRTKQDDIWIFIDALGDYIDERISLAGNSSEWRNTERLLDLAEKLETSIEHLIERI